MKMIDHKKTSTNFDDMCDDVIDLILCHLQLEDLANISDTSRRLKTIASSVFSRKHTNHLISIDCFDHSEAYLLSHIYISFKIKPIVRISDAKIWFKLLRNFGKLFKYLRIQMDPVTMTNEDKILTSWKNINNYVLDYCIDSLEVLELMYYTYFDLNRPLPNLQQFLGKVSSIFETVELMPNLHCLSLRHVPQTLKKCFSKLEEVSMQFNGGEEVDSFISFLQMNQQIKILKLGLHSSSYNDLIFFSIIENLTQLKALNIRIYYEDATEIISIYKFKTIDTFTYGGLGRSMNTLLKSFQFNDLQEMALEFSLEDTDWLNFVLRNTKLKTLSLICSKNARTNGDLQKLLRELPDLEKIRLHGLNEKAIKIVKQILGDEWKHIHIDEPFMYGQKYRWETFLKIFMLKKNLKRIEV